MKQLSDIGVSAIRASNGDASDVAKGKYWFGMFLTSTQMAV